MQLSKSTRFSIIFFLMAFAQTVVMTVLPVEALRLLGDARAVSLAYFGVGLAGFAGRLSIPFIVRRIGRFGVFVLGAAALCLSGGLLVLERVTALVPGLFLNVFAFACFEIVINLYVLDQIARSELGRFEAKRIFFAAAPFTLGPWLGINLQIDVARWIPFAISAAAACMVPAAFWISGLMAEARMRAAVPRSANPLRYLPRFFAQPRLRLGWALAAGRSSWWTMFQIYAPIFAVKSGLGAEVGGVIVSIGIGWMWLVPFWGWVGRRYGLRRLYWAGYATAGAISLAAAALMQWPVLGAVALLMAAFATESIDGGGNTLYLRAVHPYERSEMTAVFASYRDMSQLVPPGVFALLLTVFDLEAVFVAAGIMMLGLAGLTRYIPRRF
ncbi:MAG TPA: hypothetical protein VMG55_13585 [Stellaceae bacterium]|nr:hypothetical protein [Stellaceae bacterium]